VRSTTGCTFIADKITLHFYKGVYKSMIWIETKKRKKKRGFFME